MSKHTPGPWRREGVNIYAKAPANIEPHIARVIYEHGGDGNLIAAAPEMIEALRRLISRAESEIADPDDVAEILTARRVIAKAEGRE